MQEETKILARSVAAAGLWSIAVPLLSTGAVLAFLGWYSPPDLATCLKVLDVRGWGAFAKTGVGVVLLGVLLGIRSWPERK